ncbi:hypothetical protein EAG_06550 [Camponotus floridanus]|uniref:Uncharacterized protein n=1 Tax=Camponotus floridanus TaxID=104421 RepID=E2A285_CAMFO|nr:hypothetical protein EAG_06550 [Camponotus floridanus]
MGPGDRGVDVGRGMRLRWRSMARLAGYGSSKKLQKSTLACSYVSDLSSQAGESSNIAESSWTKTQPTGKQGSAIFDQNRATSVHGPSITGPADYHGRQWHPVRGHNLCKKIREPRHPPPANGGGSNNRQAQKIQRQPAPRNSKERRTSGGAGPRARGAPLRHARKSERARTGLAPLLMGARPVKRRLEEDDTWRTAVRSPSYLREVIVETLYAHRYGSRVDPSGRSRLVFGIKELAIE